jgi:hypothetical protein
LSLLLDEQEQRAAADDFIPMDKTRERSPRRKPVDIPTSGLPPWRAPQ